MVEGRVKAVVFDLGGVLIDWNPRYLYEKLIPDEGQRERFLAEVCSLEWNARMDRGIPFAKAIRSLQNEHPEWSEEIAAYFDRWPEMISGEIPGSVALLEKLVGEGVPVYALTNWSAETFLHARGRFPFLGWFKDIVVSGEERMAKPEIAIFSLMLDRNRLEPSETLFIDDQERNVQAARLAGMQAVTFTNSEALSAELIERGLLMKTQP